MKLISNDITVTEQFAIRAAFNRAAARWNKDSYLHGADMDALRVESGVRCTYIKCRGLVGFDLEDPVQYTCFLLRWS
jgi:hypothetical protein